VALADLEVDLVVGRGDLERARAELRVDRGVGHDGDRRPVERPPDGAADHPGIAGVVRVHGDRDVARDRLRPGGRDLDELARRVDQLVAHLVEGAVRPAS
jgi:hypothetical protein